MSAALAVALAGLAERELPGLDGAARARAAGAIARFAGGPAPSSFLVAVRALREGSRSARADRLRERAAGGSFEGGAALLRAVPGLEPELAVAVLGVPVDARAGLRLAALAQLLTAHHELTSRVAAEESRLRALLADPGARRAAAPRGKGRGLARSAAAPTVEPAPEQAPPGRRPERG